jgi:hypothetical protein
MLNDLELLVESTITSINLRCADSCLEVEVKSPWEERAQKRIVVQGIDKLLMQGVCLYNIIDRVTLLGAEDFVDCASKSTERLFLLI